MFLTLLSLLTILFPLSCLTLDAPVTFVVFDDLDTGRSCHVCTFRYAIVSIDTVIALVAVVTFVILDMILLTLDALFTFVVLDALDALDAPALVPFDALETLEGLQIVNRYAFTIKAQRPTMRPCAKKRFR